MRIKNIQEPAFPILENADYNGMTLRDYFAAKAMQGLLSNCREIVFPEGKLVDIGVSKMSYILADKMMEEREVVE